MKTDNNKKSHIHYFDHRCSGRRLIVFDIFKFSLLLQILIFALMITPAYAQQSHPRPSQVHKERLEKSRNLPAKETTVKEKAGTQSSIAPAKDQVTQDMVTQDKVMLNFANADLKGVIHTISEITGKNFILGSAVSGKITVKTTQPIPRKEVFGIFESILEVNGLAAVKTGSYYKIVSSTTARQKGIEVRESTEPGSVPFGDKVMTQIVPVEFIATKDLLPILQSMLSPAGSITNYAKSNSLIITDVASNIKKTLVMINLLDVDAFQRMNMAFLSVNKVDVRTLYLELTDILNSLGLDKGTAQLSIVPIDRLNSLVVFSSSKQLLQSVEEWVGRLDSTLAIDGTAVDDSTIHIYYVKNDRASNIKSILDQILTGKSAVPKTVSSQMSAKNTISNIPFGFHGNISVFLYEPFNALIVQASPQDYRKIANTIKALDRLPKQVLIETLIVEVKLDETTKYGVQWSLLSGKFDFQQNTGIFSSVINDPQSPILTPIGATTPAGLSVFATDAEKFYGVIQALGTEGKVNVLSNPHIIVKNYEKASINIGSDEPIATQSTQSAVTGTTALIQNIEYRKTGIILTVTPQITEGGMIALSIRQEVSDKSTDRIVGSGTFPSFTKREAETSVIAKDNQTLVIGGLIQEKNDKTVSGIPLLKDIPILGKLFGVTTNTVAKTELIILMTPRIISNSEQAATLTEQLKSKLKGLKHLLEKSD